MAYDIYGGSLEPGHCEVHPEIAESYPCSVCVFGDTSGSDYHRSDGGPCSGCFYATGKMQSCDGSCSLPHKEWRYFKNHPLELAQMNKDLGKSNNPDDIKIENSEGAKP